jgi:hypothetical protein
VFTNNSSSQGNDVPLDSFSWVCYDGTTQTTTDVNQTVSDFFDFENSFLTTLTVTDEFGCVSGSAFTITDLTKPTANFAVDTVLCDLENFNAVNQSLGSGPLTYEWLIDGSYQDNTLNYSNQFDGQPSNLCSSVQHTLSLVTTDVNGCLDTLEVPIHVSLPHADANFSFSGATINAQGEFVCPPVFASLNDSSSSFGNVTNWNWTFGKGNRWGNVVKQAQDHTGVLLWDGNANSGNPCTEGVYFYKISGELYDGTPITKHGNVTLVR